MKTLVIYYSHTGHTKKLAEALAQSEGADIFEVKDKNRPNGLKAFTVGCYKAMGMKGWEIQPLTVKLDEYDRLIVMSPVWAGHTAPPVNTLFGIIPAGKLVEVRAVSASGKSRAGEKIAAMLKEKGCESVIYRDVRAG